MSPSEAYKIGTTAFQAGQFEQALKHLKTIKHPDALHLAALSAQKLGTTDLAATLFKKAAGLAPHNANIANNRGHFELGRGRARQAETYFKQALSITPTLLGARIGLAKIRAAASDWPGAIDAWQTVLDQSPQSPTGRYGLATAYFETGQVEQAVQIFEPLLQDNDGPEIAFMLGRAYLALNQLEAAQRLFENAHSRLNDADTLRNLANLYWMRGDQAGFDRLIETASDALRLTCINLILETGDLTRADALWAETFANTTPGGEGWILKSMLARLAGNAETAHQAARQALRLAPDNRTASDALIVSQLMTANSDAAYKSLAPLRRKEPDAQHWIAHETVADRLQQSSSRLLEVERFIRAYDIETPPGYDSLDAFNTDFVTLLKEWHPLAARPLNQSLRGGTQTTRDLLDSDHPVITAYRAALDGPIRAYLDAIGTDKDHPTSARNRHDYQFAGMWSVKLNGRGYHESHVHPAGWISSAYYVAVPDGIDTSPDKAGWIDFGVPPYQTGNDALPPLKTIAPRPGRLVLFPSFMWHGTRPIADDGERITAPFDLLPA